MKKQLLLGLMLSTLPLLVFAKDGSSQDSTILRAFYSLCYKLYNSHDEKEAYKSVKALNKLSRLYISKNTAVTHNKLLTELNVLEPNGCFSKADFSKMIPLTATPSYALNMSAEDYQQCIKQVLHDAQQDAREKLIIFLFDFICFINNKQERHDLCKAFFELMQAVKLNNKQIKNAILIKFGLVDDQGIILEETINSVYRLPNYLYEDFLEGKIQDNLTQVM